MALVLCLWGGGGHFAFKEKKLQNLGIDPAVPLTDLGDGTFVESDVLRIVEAIAEYDPNLRVQYLESAGNAGDPPFRVIERCRDGVDRVAFTAWELDGRLLERIMKADCAKRDLDAVITDANIKAKAELKRRYRESLEEAQEIAFSVLRSRKSKYTVRHPETGELLTFTE